MNHLDNHRGVARAYAWWWLIFLAVIGIALWRGWRTSYGYRFASGLRPHVAVPDGTASTQQMQAEISGVLALDRATRLSVIGKNVAFHHIPVLAVMGNKGFWIGSATGYRLLVVGNLSNTPSAYMSLAGAKDGDLVDVSGIVKQMPPAAQAKLIFSLSESGAKALESEQVCVLAAEITVLRD